MATFFVSSTRSVHFFVHLFNIINLYHGPPKHIRNARTSSKTKKHRPTEPRKHKMSPFGVFHSDFSKCDFYLKFFWIPPKGFSFVCFHILQHNGSQKIPKGPVFGTVTLLKNLILKIFTKFLKNLLNVPLSCFSYFATNWSFTKPERSPLSKF